ncbi:GerAB/ArcD/ProY family transporter [Paenibacillus xanthanilyticus]|uniref:GerAB/ArcD/ProY family transporter n=1 Tax=Paenibacillus xanthanilyticus TaxID=1783531 RepID=A0ABV8K7V5_9BACL
MIKDGHIGYNGWICLVVLTQTVKIFDASSHLLVEKGGQTAWIISLIGGGFNLLFVYAVIRFMRSNPGESFLTILQTKVGNWASKLYGVNVFMLMIVSGFLHLRLSIDQIKIVTMPNTPFSVILLLILGLVVLLVVKGIETLSRMAATLVPWLVLMYFTLVVLLYQHLSLYNISPLLGPGIIQLVKKGISHSLYFGEPLGLCLLANLVREQKDFEKGLWRGTIYSVLMISGLVLVYQLAMGTPSSVNITFPFVEMTRYIYVNRFIQHLEGFYATIWLMMDFTQMGINMFFITYIFCTIFSVSHYRPLAIGFASLYFLLALSPTFFYQTLIWERELIKWGGYSTYGMLFLFGFWAICKQKGSFR